LNLNCTPHSATRIITASEIVNHFNRADVISVILLS
jgi:hypothetical protein